MKPSHRVSVSMIASVFVIAIVLVFIVSDHFSSIASFNTSKSEFSLPVVKLQTKVRDGTDDEFRAVFSDRSTVAGSSVNRRFRNRTVIRGEEGGLEQLLARSRAAIRKAALSRNSSSNVHEGDVYPGDIYHNPPAFYQ
ncbi:hypothetical protein U1Q18_018627 [Sarracenia purpurea var. burkii]